MLPFQKFPEPPAAVSLTGKAAISWHCCWKRSYPPYPSFFLSPLGCPSQKNPVSSPIWFTIQLHKCLHWQKRWARERMAGGRNDFCQRQSWLETLSSRSQITAKIVKFRNCFITESRNSLGFFWKQLGQQIFPHMRTVLVTATHVHSCIHIITYLHGTPIQDGSSTAHSWASPPENSESASHSSVYLT